MLPIICECRYYTTRIHFRNCNCLSFAFGFFCLLVSAAQPLPEMAIVTITSAPIMIIEETETLALRQTPSHCDSVVHLRNVPSHPLPEADVVATRTTHQTKVYSRQIYALLYILAIYITRCVLFTVVCL